MTPLPSRTAGRSTLRLKEVEPGCAELGNLYRAVSPGARSPEQIERNVDLYRRRIPDDLWSELESEALLRADAQIREI